MIRSADIRRLLPHGNWTLSVGLAMTLVLIILMFAAPLITGQDASSGELERRLLSPGEKGFLLGSDHLGRSIWSRVLAGLGWSVSAAVIATAVAFSIGVPLGLWAAGSAGWVRTSIRWLVDLVIALPALVVAICVMAVVGQGWLPLVLTLGVLGWPVFARVVYADGLSLLERDYVKAARMVGSKETLILAYHVLPGMRGSLAAVTAFFVADMLIAESALSFLGIGAPLGAPTWGNMLADSRPYLFAAPWLLLVPATAIVFTVVAANLIGSGLTASSSRSVKAAP